MAVMREKEIKKTHKVCSKKRKRGNARTPRASPPLSDR